MFNSIRSRLIKRAVKLIKELLLLFIKTLTVKLAWFTAYYIFYNIIKLLGLG